jgi:peptide-methionine (S)-S-oxide reductase
MKRRTPLAALLLALVAFTAAHAASTTHGKSSTPASAARTEVATFAMGCFWCGETQFESQPGVLSVISGYTGGREEHPTYEQVSDGGTGHYESVQVTFDPAKTSYAKMLDLFWHGIDPTQDDGQFCDRGSQYRSVVFVADDKQRKLAEDTKHAIEASGVLHEPIVTQILPATHFWPAEDYHQDFWKKDPVRYRTYRLGCGRDRRLVELWGALASKPLVH